MKTKNFLNLLLISLVFASCKNFTIQGDQTRVVNIIPQGLITLTQADVKKTQGNTDGKTLTQGNWLQFEVNVEQSGRYQITVYGSAMQASQVWIEDYVNNKDGRVYDITGKIQLSQQIPSASKFGSPLATGMHTMRLHLAQGNLKFDSITFLLMSLHQDSPTLMTQNMQGNEWEVVWSDEFDYEGLPDASKWSYNVGDWGWGNNELQYYTHRKLENARVENGYLVIEAHKIPGQEAWTSARLTTQGKAAFTYGKIEFKAKVPTMRGTWAAGWTLGESYRDELSWPYCGEIDILECVGYEIDDATGNGRNHASCHTRAFYFKQNNQITASTPVNNMNAEWHTYSVEWYPDSVIALVDDLHYYTYDKTANELEWPFHNPQAIILNLAIGGGWGGAQGLDPELGSQQFLVDYVRVYQRKK